jgi:hypothetical protein
MDEDTEVIEVSKNTQTFVFKLRDMEEVDAKKIVSVLNALQGQQEAESSMEANKSWRIMWEKALKEHVPYIMYFIYMSSVGVTAFINLDKVLPENQWMLFLSVGFVMVLPLLAIFYITLKTMGKDSIQNK